MLGEVALGDIPHGTGLLSVSFHEVVADVGCFSEGVYVLFVIDWVYLLVSFKGPLLGPCELVTVRREMDGCISIAKTFILLAGFFLFLLGRQVKLAVHILFVSFNML